MSKLLFAVLGIVFFASPAAKADQIDNLERRMSSIESTLDSIKDDLRACQRPVDNEKYCYCEFGPATQGGNYYFPYLHRSGKNIEIGPGESYRSDCQSVINNAPECQ